MNYLIAYDVADPRRLRRAARACERKALRCQKSVYLFRGTEAALVALLTELTGLLDAKADLVQAWRLHDAQPLTGRCHGRPAQVAPAAVVLSPGPVRVVSWPSPVEELL